MPTYEYNCSNCGHDFEQLQSIKAKPLRKCPKCGKLTLKRLIGTGSGVIFKGSGFYTTDYRSEGYKEAAKKDAPEKKQDTDKGKEKKETAKTPAKTELKSTGDSKPKKKSK